MVHWMINCKEHSELVSEAMDHTLPLKSRMAVKLHQWVCSPCRFFARQMYALRTICRIKTELEKLTSI